MKFLKKIKKQDASSNAASAYGSNSYGAQHTVGRETVNTQAGKEVNEEFAPKPFRYAPQLSKLSFDIGGLPVSVFGLDELTPASSRALAPTPPELCIAVHCHGRGGSAENEEKIVRQLWDRVRRSRADAQAKGGQKEESMREFLVVSFDARNHGHRLTNEVGQKGWKQGNIAHGYDLYAMIVGTASDVSFIVDFLPSYLFPHDERKVAQWAVTGKSLGGHAAWHVLANDARISIGVPFISCPSYARLMAQRAPSSFVSNGPPHIPNSLAKLIATIDPASKSFDVPDPNVNPFWGKRICMCSGQQDRLVPWQCASEFVDRLVLGPPNVQRSLFRVVLLEGVGHEVTEQMIEEGGHWIFLHGMRTN